MGAGKLLTVGAPLAAGRAQLVVAARGLRCPAARGIALTRDHTCIPCIAKQILNFWATRDTLILFLMLVLPFVVLICPHLIFNLIT